MADYEMTDDPSSQLLDELFRAISDPPQSSSCGPSDILSMSVPTVNNEGGQIFDQDDMRDQTIGNNTWSHESTTFDDYDLLNDNMTHCRPCSGSPGASTPSSAEDGSAASEDGSMMDEDVTNHDGKSERGNNTSTDLHEADVWGEISDLVNEDEDMGLQDTKDETSFQEETGHSLVPRVEDVPIGPIQDAQEETAQVIGSRDEDGSIQDAQDEVFEGLAQGEEAQDEHMRDIRAQVEGFETEHDQDEEEVFQERARYEEAQNEYMRDIRAQVEGSETEHDQDGEEAISGADRESGRSDDLEVENTDAGVTESDYDTTSNNGSQDPHAEDPQLMSIIPVNEVSKRERRFKNFHLKAAGLVPHKIAPDRYWVAILHHTVEPRDARKEKDFLWIKANRMNTVETIWHTYQNATTEDAFEFTIHGEHPRNGDIMEELDYYNDKLVVMRASIVKEPSHLVNQGFEDAPIVID